MAFFPPGLVWLASYPKSGNTWMRVLLANLRADTALPVGINNLAEPFTLIGSWRFADDLLVDPDLLDDQDLERLRPLQCDFVAPRVTTPFFCKTHDRFFGRSRQPLLGTRAWGAVYMVRDPRDVAVSMRHHSGMSLDATIAAMHDSDFYLSSRLQLRSRVGDWAGHVSEWTGQNFLRTKVVRYEDLRVDTAGVVKDIVSFLGGRATDEDIHRAVAYSSLNELQQQEATKGFRERLPGQDRFFRSGRVGEWRDVLTASQVRTLEDRFAPVMAQLGYHPES
jgi:aryl sulfotransferase